VLGGEGTAGVSRRGSQLADCRVAWLSDRLVVFAIDVKAAFLRNDICRLVPQRAEACRVRKANCVGVMKASRL
jgi:hypothetical protein